MAKEKKDIELELNKEKSSKEKLAKEANAKAKVKETKPKKDSTKKKVAKKNTTKETSTKETVAKKSTSKNATTKKVSSKNATSKKPTTKKASSKNITAKKTTTRKSTARKTTRKKHSTSFQAEYYDLPYNYNQTIVKVLAQTPTTLFVYWEVSEDDKNKFKQAYGENFFEVTKPVLILYNDTLNYSFEIEINDFANSWYIHVNDSKCDYHVEFGRKPIPQQNANNQIAKKTPYIPYYIYITSSNEMAAPNNRVLFRLSPTVTFRNIKTGEIRERNIKEFKFITNYGIFTIEELYKYLYPNENFNYEHFLINPSSGMTSSRSYSSQFK